MRCYFCLVSYWSLYRAAKGMEVSFRADRLARAAFYVRRGDLVRASCGSAAPGILMYGVTLNCFRTEIGASGCRMNLEASASLILRCRFCCACASHRSRRTCNFQDRGKLATPEEVAEAGSPDCPICFEEMERPLLLPCQHLFCVECVAEW